MKKPNYRVCYTVGDMAQFEYFKSLDVASLRARELSRSIRGEVVLEELYPEIHDVFQDGKVILGDEWTI